jgi:hypothetical protein
MAERIENAAELAGASVQDQDGANVGEIRAVYGVGEEQQPMWVTVESSLTAATRRELFLPLARLKREDGQLRVPYSKRHLHDSPEVSASGELSGEDDRRLRDFYAIDLADTEQRVRGESYAAQVPDEDAPATRIEDSG